MFGRSLLLFGVSHFMALRPTGSKSRDPMHNPSQMISTSDAGRLSSCTRLLPLLGRHILCKSSSLCPSPPPNGHR
jgi:hypothetical protein